MENNAADMTPIFVSLIVAVVGGLGGLAALLKVQSDNTNSLASGAKSVTEGAKTVVDLMNERMDEGEARLDNLEEYVSHFDAWADRLLDTLDRVISLLPDALREQYRCESEAIKSSRPKRVVRSSGKQPPTSS